MHFSWPTDSYVPPSRGRRPPSFWHAPHPSGMCPLHMPSLYFEVYFSLPAELHATPREAHTPPPPRMRFPSCMPPIFHVPPFLVEGGFQLACGLACAPSRGPRLSSHGPPFRHAPFLSSKRPPIFRHMPPAHAPLSL